MALSVCLTWGFSVSVSAQDPDKIWLREGPHWLLDTQEVMDQMDIARDLAGDDYYFQTTQRLQCNDIDDTYTVVQTPGPNVLPPDFMSTGYAEAPAVPTKVFDNVYYVGGMEVGGWLIDTGNGYIMLDSSYDYGYEDILLPNMEALGLDPAQVKFILVTHAGPDHIGAAWKFQRDYGTKVVFNRKLTPPPWNPNAAMPAVTVMNDGDALTLGNTTITMVLTPRNVGGDGFSYLIPVKIKNKRHMWATFGNTGITGTLADKAVYRESMAKFLAYVDELGADIAMSSHPFVDASLDRMEIIRECDERTSAHHGYKHGANDQRCLNNPFLIGKKAARRYFEIMDQCAEVQIKRQESGLNSTGLEYLQ